jgi:hypothetical protein
MSDRTRIQQLRRGMAALAVLAMAASTFGTTAEAGWPFGNGGRRGAWTSQRYYVNPAPRYQYPAPQYQYYYYATPPARGVAPRYVVPPVQPGYVVPPGYRPYAPPAAPRFQGAPEIPMPIMLDRSSSGWKPSRSLLA